MSDKRQDLPTSGQAPFFWVFSPFQTNPELLEAIFTGRENLLLDVISKVTQSALTAAKHYILLHGQRGIGKTNFLALLHHRLGQNPEISQKIRIAILNEDEISASFAQFLVRIYRALAADYPAEFPLDQLESILDLPHAQVAQALTREMIDRLQSHTLVLIIENLDDVFKAFGRQGQHAFRSFLTNHQRTTVIATSQQISDEFNDREGPFYGFFRQIALKPFSADDSHEILKKLASLRGQEDLVAYLQSPEGRGRVRAIHHLAGGNQRVYMVLSSLVTPESLDHLVAPFQKLADELTPYYQERIWSLPPLQRTVIQEFCRSPLALSPSAMARRLVADEKTIGKQMNLLEERNYLTKTTRGRESFYELAEPLMRISFEVKERKLLELLVNFLRCWYDPASIENHRSQATTESALAYFEAAIERSATSPDPRLKIFDDEIEKARRENREHELAKIWEEKAVITKNAEDYFQAGYYYATVDEDFMQSIACFDRALEIEPDHDNAWILKGISLNNLKRYDDAIACFDRALEIKPDFAIAWNNKGLSLLNLKRYEEAIACYDRALEIKPDHVIAWYNKGISLLNLKRYEEAIACYDRALEIKPDHVIAWYNKGNALDDLKRYDDAIACYDRALEIKPDHANAWYNKGNALNNLKRYDEAIACYDRALEMKPDDAIAWNNKGFSLSKLKRYDEAIACFERAIEIDGNDPFQQYNKVELFFYIDRWPEAFEKLAEIRVKIDRSDYFGDVASMLAILFEKSNDTESLRQRLEMLFQHYEKLEQKSWPGGKPDTSPLDCFGYRLVKSLAKLDSGRFTRRVLETYVAVADSVLGPQPRMELPLRLFRYGVQYLNRLEELKATDPRKLRDTPEKQAEAVLVELVSTEREIVRQALGLVPMPS